MRPPGWPDGVPDPEHPEFDRGAVAWLLDIGPGEWRGIPAFKEHPAVLAYRAGEEIRGRLEGARGAYAGLRRSLAEDVPPEVMDQALAALEKEGALLLARQREVALVAEALRGRRWRPRLGE